MQRDEWDRHLVPHHHQGHFIFGLLGRGLADRGLAMVGSLHMVPHWPCPSESNKIIQCLVILLVTLVESGMRTE